jgi:hypothetical protein
VLQDAPARRGILEHMTAPPPPHAAALLRHCADLRDGTHGATATTREEKERLFRQAVDLLDPHARRALDEIDTHLLLGTGDVSASGVHRSQDGGLAAQWDLSWPEQRATGLSALRLRAFYGASFHHPHLRGATVGEWPLNVFTPEQAAGELSVLRAIVAADLHNFVFQRDYRVVPATTARPEPS